MSSVKVYSVHCDLPAAEHPHGSTCTGWTGNCADLAEARQQARDGGWLRTGGKDYCPAARKVVKP
jgi:hypothetical protein